MLILHKYIRKNKWILSYPTLVTYLILPRGCQSVRVFAAAGFGGRGSENPENQG